MTTPESRRLGGGINQHGLRNHNERVILSMIQREGSIPGSEIARSSGLSPQTVSVILRRLEQEGLIDRGAPMRGRVGKPSVPMALSRNGVLSLGLKIGRRSAELGLMNFRGELLKVLEISYRYPVPNEVFDFLKAGVAEIMSPLSAETARRVVGLGVATPFELWNWHELIGAPEAEMAPWRDVDFASRIAPFTDLPVFVQNDATAACRAEHVYGRGSEYADYAYFFVGAFVGGGVVLNNGLYEGHYGNAGAFATLHVHGAGKSVQLIERASIYVLEDALAHENAQMAEAPRQAIDWETDSDDLLVWLGDAASALAEASQTICSVIDFQAILIDGAFPAGIRARLAEMTAQSFSLLDTRGLRPPIIGPGAVGSNARILGAACAPVFSQFLLDTNSGLARSRTDRGD